MREVSRHKRREDPKHKRTVGIVKRSYERHSKACLPILDEIIPLGALEQYWADSRTSMHGAAWFRPAGRGLGDHSSSDISGRASCRRQALR